VRWVVGRGVLGSLLLTLGGLCYVRISRPSWVSRNPFWRTIRHSPQHLHLGLAVSALGLLLLTWAWLGLRRFAGDELTGLRSVRIAVAAWSVPLLIAPPLFSGDGWSYVATGVLTGRGLSPYHWTPILLSAPLRSGVNPRWLFTPTPYGPLALGWGGVASRVTSDPWALLVAYRLLAVLGLVLLFWATPRLATRCGRPAGTATWLVLASPFMLAHGIGGLHNDLVTAGLGAAALVVTRTDRWVWGALLAGASASVKVPGGLIAVGVVLLSLQAGSGYVARLRRSAQVGVVAAGSLAGLGLITGVGAGWLSALSVPASVPTRLSVTRSIGIHLKHWLVLAGVPWTYHGITVVHLMQGLGVLAVLTGAVLLLLTQRCGEDPPVLLAVAVLMLATTVLSPVLHYWYFLWCLPLLACVALEPPLRYALAGLVAALGITAVADPSLHVRGMLPGAELALVLGPLLAGSLGVTRHRAHQLAEATYP
jgi:hypothetical protein